MDLILVGDTPAEPVEALMGELSWYHKLHGVYVEVVHADLFTAPTTWPARARRFPVPNAPDVRIVVPHPHDVLVSKLERYAPRDQDHATLILDAMPLEWNGLAALVEDSPYRNGTITADDRCARFETHLDRLRAQHFDGA